MCGVIITAKSAFGWKMIFSGTSSPADCLRSRKRGCAGDLGVGDRSTGPAERGTKGHTSGINIVVVRASDEINNAQRRGDFATSLRIENEIAALEEIRFRDSRMYNYSAVVEAMHLGGFDDVDGGEGGPFNPRVPAAVAEEVAAAIEGIVHYH